MTTESPTICRIVLADDHAIFRQGVATLIERESDLKVVGEAGDGEEAVACYRRLRPDVTLLDLVMPRLDGFEALLRIRHMDPEAKVIVLTTYDTDEDINRILRAGAKAYLLKDVGAADLVRCIRDVAAGRMRLAQGVASKLADRFTQVQLTVREVSVLRLVAEGLNNRAIGQRLGISEGTVKVHVAHLFDKMGARSRTDLVAIAVRKGLVRLGSG
ncbi:MAG TPA: response regulator transcription factor [Caulobacteraceae bacterium]|nr:response regulator transcription factor [Caulobacteraceae bacterium]